MNQPPVYYAPPPVFRWHPNDPNRPTNGMALASLILAFLLPVLGLILGIVAMNQCDRTGERGGGIAGAAVGVAVGMTAVYGFLWLVLGR